MELPGMELIVGDNSGDGDSSQSIVLQYGAPGDVEQGEEMVYGETRGNGRSVSAALQAYCSELQLEMAGKGLEMQRLVRGLAAKVEKWGDIKKVGCVGQNAYETGVGLAGDSGDVVRARVPNRSDEDFTNACLHNQRGSRRIVGKGGFQARKSFMPRRFGVDESRGEIERDSYKRKNGDMKYSGPVPEDTMYEDAYSKDNLASSSFLDANDSETEQCTKKKSNIKRKKREGGTIEIPQRRPEKFCQHTDPRRSSSLRDQQEFVDCDEVLNGMQALLEMQLQASERSEAGMNQRMEMVMDMLFVYMGHAEKRVSHLEKLAQPHEQVLDRIGVKLEKVMEGLTTLNENFFVLSACLFRNTEPQGPH